MPQRLLYGSPAIVTDDLAVTDYQPISKANTASNGGC